LVAHNEEERRLRAFENMVLRRAFGPKREEVSGEWRKIRIELLNDLHSLPNIFRVIKSRRVRWAGHVASMGITRGVFRVLVGKSEERDYLGDPGVDGRIILRWIFRKVDMGVWTGSRWLGMRIGGGTWEYGN